MAGQESQAEWKVKVGSKELGPVDLEVLRHWARVGRLSPEDLVFDPDAGAWVPARNLPQLAGMFAPPPQAKRRSVFTRPVSIRSALLVVLGFIALLAVIAMFLPGPPSRPLALRHSCMINMRQIGIALTQYAEDFDNRYPWRVGMSNPEMAWTDLGLLYPAHADDPMVFICPSTKESGSWFQGNLDPMPFAPATTTQVISYSYCYNGGGAVNTPWSSDAPATTRLLADKKAGIEVTGPAVKKVAHEAQGRSVLYNDGHVEWERGIEALDPDPENPETGKPGALGAQSAPDYSDWWSDPPFYAE